MKNKINILGTEYTIIESGDYEKFDKLNADGFCEWWDKQIHLRKDAKEEKDGCMTNMHEYYNNILRHEIVHCFLFESGMQKYERDEELVEWIARFILKMHESMNEVGCL